MHMQSIALDRRTGSRCLMLSASKLDVASANNDHHWKWISREVEEGYWKMTLIPGSRFPKVAELLSGVNLEINGEVDTAELSRQTMYAFFFVFELSYPFGFLGRIQEASITLGFHTTQHTVCLSPEREQQSFWRQNLVKTPQSRSDGWKEVEMGEFYVKEGGGGGDGGRSAVHMSLNGFGKNLKGGLIVHGIEVRPKTRIRVPCKAMK
ncbi:hypothetical protein Taro_010488 [Colocasia esculenta]|uniref:Uncharacterized protein n=1 Tax=Colocasia esculenta TaxID=4460 RepID=A0A843U7Q9_COLES|nr:hypothetical protein [Colocasia esculenta]